MSWLDKRGGGRPLIFFDTETTGTNPLRHEVWELAALKLEGSELTEFSAQLTVNLAEADPKALEIGNFEGRYDPQAAERPDTVISRFSEFSKGGVLAALNVSFDMGFLAVLLDKANLVPTWHYSPLEVKSFAAGALRLAPPYQSEEIAKRLGIDPESYARHEALADCYYTRDIYQAALTYDKV